MEDAIQNFMKYLDLERGASHETIKGYKSDLRQFVDFLRIDHGNVVPNPMDVETQNIRKFLGSLVERRCKKSSQARKLASIRSLFRFLHQKGIIKTNPVMHIKSPRLGQHLPRVLTKDDAERLMAVSYTHLTLPTILLV